MVVKMESFYILGVHLKIRLLGREGSRKTNMEGAIA